MEKKRERICWYEVERKRYEIRQGEATVEERGGQWQWEKDAEQWRERRSRLCQDLPEPEKAKRPCWSSRKEVIFSRLCHLISQFSCYPALPLMMMMMRRRDLRSRGFLMVIPVPPPPLKMLRIGFSFKSRCNKNTARRSE